MTSANPAYELEQPSLPAAERKQIATVILQQMGGPGKLMAMLGVDQFVILDSGVQFRFKGSRRFNICRVILDRGSDTYIMELGQIRKCQGSLIFFSRVREFDVYADQLSPIFEAETGLRLSL